MFGRRPWGDATRRRADVSIHTGRGSLPKKRRQNNFFTFWALSYPLPCGARGLRRRSLLSHREDYPHPMPAIPILRRNDQRSLAVLATLALVMMGGWWMTHRRAGVGMVDIDRAEPIAVQYQVDLNRADWPELLLLPGIGPTLAQRIVEHRAERGGYETVEELTAVPGIGPKTLKRISPYLRVEVASDSSGR